MNIKKNKLEFFLLPFFSLDKIILLLTKISKIKTIKKDMRILTEGHHLNDLMAFLRQYFRLLHVLFLQGTIQILFSYSKKKLN